MPKPSLNKDAEQQARELQKIAGHLLSLADKVEREERNRNQLHPRRAMTSTRQNQCHRAACDLLMQTLAFGGPKDEDLRTILSSWRDKSDVSWRCFEHVCLTWKPLRESQEIVSTANLLDCAQALRVIASGITLPRA